jgi:hypothetical protein
MCNKGMEPEACSVAALPGQIDVLFTEIRSSGFTVTTAVVNPEQPLTSVPVMV